MLFDLHIHSKCSLDGTLDPKELVKIAVKRGLDGIAVTDHGTIRGGLMAREYATTGFCVAVGAEIRTDRGDVIGLFLSQDIKSREFGRVIAEIRDQNGLAIIPHPFDNMRRSALLPSDNEAGQVDAVEVFNSRCIFSVHNKMAKDLAERLSKGISAGSDAHFGNEVGLAGVITEDEDLREAILKGELRTFGRRSPLTNHCITKVLKLWRKVEFG